jgi:hypothetical protein
MKDGRFMTAFDVRDLRGSLVAHRTLDAYIEQLVVECPGLPEPTLRTWSISATDAVLVHEVLDSFTEPVDVLDVGTFLGVSAFLFASHPMVERVITIDPNPYIADEINDKQDELAAYVDPTSLRGIRVHDVARATLARFPDVAGKIEIFEGVLSGPTGGTSGATIDRFDISNLKPSESNNRLVALIDGLHTSDAVHGDLGALLSARPDAMALIDDCRYYWGPFVQAGVARFIGENPGRFDFRLFADLSTALAGSQLAVLYASDDDSFPRSLGQVVSSLSETLDPLQMLEREQEVVASASAAFDRDAAEARWREEESTLRSLEAEVAYLRRIYAESHLQVSGMSNHMATISQELQAARAELDSMRASMSWKLTKPLRRSRSMVRRRK